MPDFQMRFRIWEGLFSAIIENNSSYCFIVNESSLRSLFTFWAIPCANEKPLMSALSAGVWKHKLLGWQNALSYVQFGYGLMTIAQ